jgi:hypothetical protein
MLHGVIKCTYTYKSGGVLTWKLVVPCYKKMGFYKTNTLQYNAIYLECINQNYTNVLGMILECHAKCLTLIIFTDQRSSSLLPETFKTSTTITKTN